MNYLNKEDIVNRCTFFYTYAPIVEDATNEVKFPSVMIAEGGE